LINKIKTLKELEKIIIHAKKKGLKIISTNGCFDILHLGHVKYLEKARALGDILIVGINSDESVRKLKGNERPIRNLIERMKILAALESVNYVFPFYEDTPIAWLQKLKPAIHVKGGDYDLSQIPEYKVVKNYGGKFVIIPFVKNYSTSAFIEKIKYGESKDSYSKDIYDHLKIVDLISKAEFKDKIIDLSKQIIIALKMGNKVLIFGNGGSAADAQHFVAELVGHFECERKALPAIALTTNTSNLTSIGNDYSFDDIFARQIEALGQKGDVAIGISTSGRSKNVLKALEKAKKGGLYTVAITGKKGIQMKGINLVLPIPSENTQRIQEATIIAIHLICKEIEKNIR